MPIATMFLHDSIEINFL